MYQRTIYGGNAELAGDGGRQITYAPGFRKRHHKNQLYRDGYKTFPFSGLCLQCMKKIVETQNEHGRSAGCLCHLVEILPVTSPCLSPWPVSF